MSVDPIEVMFGRIHSSLRADWESCIYGTIEGMQEICESPIEVMLASAIALSGIISDGPTTPGRRPFFTFQKQDEVDLAPALIVVVPQYRWENYRIDFAFLGENLDQPIFVECDGHDFHERTKDQATRDRSKDRKIQEAGIPILRFTGSEIYRNPAKCVAQIITFFCSRARPAK